MMHWLSSQQRTLSGDFRRGLLSSTVSIGEELVTGDLNAYSGIVDFLPDVLLFHGRDHKRNLLDHCRRKWNLLRFVPSANVFEITMNMSNSFRVHFQVRAASLTSGRGNAVWSFNNGLFIALVQLSGRKYLSTP